MEIRAYSVLLPRNTPQDPVIIRNPAYTRGLLSTTDEGFTTMVEILEHAFSLYGKLPLFCRKVAGVYEWKTYGQIQELVEGFGSVLSDFCPLKENFRFMGLFSKTRMEWVIGDFACILYGVTTVPLYDTLGKEAIVHIVTQTGMETITCSADCARRLLSIHQTNPLGQLKTLILMDPIPKDIEESASALGISLHYLFDLCVPGLNAIKPHVHVNQDTVETICYTSGTTGTPKGVQVTHSNVVLGMRCRQDFLRFGCYDLHFSYLPLAHMFERNAITGITYAGGRAVFWTENPATLFQEIQMFKPTYFCSMPRIYKRLFEMIKAKLAALPEHKTELCRKALELKMQRYKSTGELRHIIYDEQVFSVAREVLGGRVRIGLSGGAPIDKNVLDFLRVTLSIPIVEGYGQTEVPGGICITVPEDTDSGHVGGPTGGVEMRLDDVPDLGYNSEYVHETFGPCPAGEICVRGPNVFPGYFKAPELTAEAFDAEGWLHTGDIGIMLPHGGIKIVDRRKHLFKLSQGEYVSPEKVEGVYGRCGLVSQCWVTGESVQDYTVVFIIPDESATKKWAATHNLSQSFPDLIARKDFQQELFDSLTKLGKESGLASFEQAKKMKVLTQPFTPDNELVTATGKLRRGVLKKCFAKEITTLYAS